MQWEEVIIGGLAIIWGILILVMRPEILELSREGGKGLRSRNVLNAVLIAAIVFLPAAGVAIIVLRGF